MNIMVYDIKPLKDYSNPKIMQLKAECGMHPSRLNQDRKACSSSSRASKSEMPRSYNSSSSFMLRA